VSATSRRVRRRFLLALLRGLRVVWPILSAILVTMAGLGAAIGSIEGWGVYAGVYFAFVTGLTIGYGDLAPSGPITRLLAIGIGFSGIMLTGLFAAIGVQALQSVTPLHIATRRLPEKDDDNDRSARS